MFRLNQGLPAEPSKGDRTGLRTGFPVLLPGAAAPCLFLEVSRPGREAHPARPGQLRKNSVGGDGRESARR